MIEYNLIFIIFIIVVKNDLYFSQIYDDFSIGILEESELLDVTDYYNINLIVTTSKNIYTGIPPVKKATTNAELINATSLMTLNENYLLAACLQDSLLTKINISSGDHSPLLNYSDIDSSLELDIPITSCSLSLLENTIFIGYSKIIYYEDDSKTKINKTNIVIKLNITYKNSDFALDLDEPIKYFIFPESTKKTDSSRQILCEPLKVRNDINDYRLICLHENVEVDEDEIGYYSYYIFATSINKNFDGFEINMREERIYRVNDPSGFKIIKINDTYAVCMMKKQVFEIFLEKNNRIVKITKISKNSNINKDFEASNDLFDYNNNLLLFSSYAFFMNKNSYYFRIHKEDISQYFILYDYYEGIPKKLLCYYNDKNHTLVIYQYSNFIKYFYLLNSNNIYNTLRFTFTGRMVSNATFNFDTKALNVASFGNLNILTIEKNASNVTKLSYGVDFYDFKIINSILKNTELSNNTWYKYSLGFIEHKENNYTRFYSPKVVFKIQTCSLLCGSCNNFYKCNECRSEDYILLTDYNYSCYPKNQYLENHIYDEITNSFEQCYKSCNFCFEQSENNSEHKCQSCAEGYLPSYKYQGNCYKINNLQMNVDKTVSNISDESFRPSNCPKYKINSTGECVEECPTFSNYYLFKSNNIDYSMITEEIIEQSYERTNINPPKYLFNKTCYDLCPSNTIPDYTNNRCKCEFSFFVNNNEELICYPDTNCSSDYPYQNPNTYECYESLNNCLEKGNIYFFNNYCYNNECPKGTITLSSKSEKIKNYYKDILSLNNDLINKLCICDTTKSVWNNITSGEEYFQECLINCPEGYKPEPITKQCINISNIEYEENYPDEYYKDPENCPVIFDNKCYLSCQEGTCLDEDDPLLINCIIFQQNYKIFNHICFTHFEQLTNNIKLMSDNNIIIEKPNGIIIRVYSINSIDENVALNFNYSHAYLRKCENKIRYYYNLSEEVELFIIGIDSPNKNKSYVTSVYNFGVYFENGTQLDHERICKDEKILISSLITDTDLIKMNEAIYFDNQGYDIYFEKNKFYTDNCAPAFINGNDITLKDRKKDFYPSDIYLCNESCYYVDIDFNSKRFTCECDLSFYYTNKTNIKVNKDEESFLDFFLSLINYKIITCYVLLFNLKNFYYNIGIYISISFFLYCFGSMIFFMIFGMKYLKIIILDNWPNRRKKLDEMKKKKKLTLIKMLDKKIKKEKNNPTKKKKIKRKKVDKSTKRLNNFNDSQEKNIKIYLGNKIDIQNSNAELRNDNHKNSRKIYNKGIMYDGIENKDIDRISKIFRLDRLKDSQVDKKELNTIPFTQALRIDKRKYFYMFLSVLAHEIEIIEIFYYKDANKHLSLVLSIYVFELGLDLALNCLFYTDDVVSEKYNNNGSIKFFTSLSLSFMSNIFASIIGFIFRRLANYTEALELIIKNIIDHQAYSEKIKKFKKYLSIKLTGFFILQIIMNISICYYLMIFCTVYHNSQGSIMKNYIVGIAESMIISLGLSIIISLTRFLGLKYQSKNFYNTSKYLFENF